LQAWHFRVESQVVQSCYSVTGDEPFLWSNATNYLVGFKPYLKDQLVFFSALRWFGHMTCKNRPRYDL